MVDQGLSLLQAAAGPLVDPGARLFLPTLVVTWCLAAVLVRGGWADGREGRGALFPIARLWTRSGRVDLALLLTNQWINTTALLGALISVPALTLMVRDALAATGSSGGWITGPPALIIVMHAVVLFVLWDLSRFALHLLMHRVPALWAFHQVHHSATSLTPLTFHRVHPVEAALFALRSVVVTAAVSGLSLFAFGEAIEPVAIFGVDAIGFVFNNFGGNLRHSHLRWGWGALERVLLSPAQHQGHHGCAREAMNSNFGTWIAIWDRIAGTWVPSADAREMAPGLPPSVANHDAGDLLSALVGPFRALWPKSKGMRALVPAAMVGLVISSPIAAYADDASATEGEDSTPAEPTGDDKAPGDTDAPAPPPETKTVGATVSVEAERARLPRVAGSAQRLSPEDLDVFDRGDIQRVLEAVPGVQARTEDGYGLRPNIGLRGAASDRSAKVMLLEDGIPIAPAPYAAPAAYYYPLPTRAVGVEVWKGASSIRHGPQTVAGAVDVQTRAVPRGPILVGDLGVGIEPDIDLHVAGGWGGAQFGLLGEFAHVGARGWKVLDGGGPTGFQRQDGMWKLRFADATGARWAQLKVGWGWEQSFETYLGLTQEDLATAPNRRYAASQRSEMNWRHGAIELRWGAAVRHGLRLDGAIWVHGLERSWTKLNGFADGPDLHDIFASTGSGQAGLYLAILRGDEDSTDPRHELLLGTNDRRYLSVGTQTLLHWTASPKDGVEHELEAGVRLIHDGVRRHHTERRQRMIAGSLVDAEGAEENTTAHLRSSALGLAAHVHEELSIGRLHLMPGLRLEVVHTEQHEHGGATGEGRWQVGVLPAFGALVVAHPNLHLYGGVHRGFSPLSPGQDEGVKPEGSWSSEAGLRYARRRTFVEATGFLNAYDNLLGQCSFAAGCAEAQADSQWNGGRALAGGLELVARQGIDLPAGLGLHFGGTYTLTRATFLESFASGSPLWGDVKKGDVLPYQPEHRAQIQVGVDLRYVRVDAAVFVVSAQRDVPGQGPITDAAHVPAQATLDLAVAVPIRAGLSAYASLENVTNQRAVQSLRPFGARPGRPFHASFGFRGTLEPMRGR